MVGIHGWGGRSRQSPHPPKYLLDDANQGKHDSQSQHAEHDDVHVHALEHEAQAAGGDEQGHEALEDRVEVGLEQDRVLALDDELNRGGEADGAGRSGVCVEAALAAADELLATRGAQVRVVDLASVRPLDEAAVLDAVGTGAVVVAQDANVAGGLGYQVAAVMANAGVSCRFRMLGCPNKFVPIATPPYLYHVNGYDAEGLARAMGELLA